VVYAFLNKHLIFFLNMSNPDTLDVPKDKVTVSAVVTRSQTSRSSVKKITDGVDARAQPRVGTDIELTKAKKIRKTTSRTKAGEMGSGRSSRVNMALFDDVDLQEENQNPIMGDDFPDGSHDSSEEDMVSVDSKLHVSLEDIIKRKTDAPKSNSANKSKTSTKLGTSDGSMTRSELVRINFEIRKMEFESEQKKLEFEGKQKKLEFEREQKKLELEFEQKKLESEERREVRRLEFKSKELERQNSEDVKVKESKDMERPKFESSSYQEKINVNNRGLPNSSVYRTVRLFGGLTVRSGSVRQGMECSAEQSERFGWFSSLKK
jgi:hypothetical protein